MRIDMHARTCARVHTHIKQPLMRRERQGDWQRRENEANLNAEYALAEAQQKLIAMTRDKATRDTETEDLKITIKNQNLKLMSLSEALQLERMASDAMLAKASANVTFKESVALKSTDLWYSCQDVKQEQQETRAIVKVAIHARTFTHPKQNTNTNTNTNSNSNTNTNTNSNSNSNSNSNTPSQGHECTHTRPLASGVPPSSEARRDHLCHCHSKVPGGSAQTNGPCAHE